MEAANLSEIEKAMAAILPTTIGDCEGMPRGKLKDTEIKQVSELLTSLGKPEWSLRPRTYAVLRLINRVDAMSSFVVEGLYDISLPCSEKTLPEALSPAGRAKFLETQALVTMTQGFDLESGHGGHAHLDQDGDTQLQRIKVLGSGGFGEVNHVFSRLSLDEFARKRILRGKTFKRDKKTLWDFERELATLKRLSHHHLVRFVGSYTDPLWVGIIMTPIADYSLAEYLRVEPFPDERKSSLRCFYGCLSTALLYLHEKKIRHKDIKPGNILVKGDNVLLTDFGTSLDYSEGGRSTTGSRPAALSVAYCSPEVAAWEDRNTSSDIWSLGCVFFEMTTVLKGKSLDQMHEFLKVNGTGGSYIRTNREATISWLRRLLGIAGPVWDNQPVEWLLNMTKINPRERPSALELIHRIKAHESAFFF